VSALCCTTFLMEIKGFSSVNPAVPRVGDFSTLRNGCGEYHPARPTRPATWWCSGGEKWNVLPVDVPHVAANAPSSCHHQLSCQATNLLLHSLHQTARIRRTNSKSFWPRHQSWCCFLEALQRSHCAGTIGIWNEFVLSSGQLYCLAGCYEAARPLDSAEPAPPSSRVWQSWCRYFSSRPAPPYAATKRPPHEHRCHCSITCPRDDSQDLGGASSWCDR
jgi:hypothetical protein